MEKKKLEEMHENLRKHIRSGHLKGRKAVVFGSNEPAERMVDFLGKEGIPVAAMIDNNSLKHHKKIDGITIYPPEEYLLPFDADIRIIIASKYYADMVLQLEQLGYQEETHIIKAVEMSPYASFSVAEDEFNRRAAIVVHGESIVNQYVADMEQYDKIFAYPPVFLGDIMIALRYFREYLEINKIEKFLIFSTSGACIDVLALYGLTDHVQTVGQDDMDALLQYFVFTDMLEGKAMILSHYLPYTSRHADVGNYKSINFADEFKYGLYQLPKECAFEIPEYTYQSEKNIRYIASLFERNALKKGKTVVLFPYAKSASLLPTAFWEELAVMYRRQGFAVCTNSANEDEAAIKGTKAVFCDLSAIREFVEMAGYMIALRSGICDILASADAEKIVIYPDRFHGPGTFMDYYGIRAMGFSDDIREVIWDGHMKPKDFIFHSLDFYEKRLGKRGHSHAER